MTNRADASAPVRALLIDGNAEEPHAIVRMLEERHAPVEIIQVSHPGEGYKYLSGDEIDLVLMGVDMQDRRHLENLRILQAHGRILPIVLLISLADLPAILEALPSNAQEYLIREHLNAELVMRSMHHTIERHRLQQHLARQAYQLRVSEANFRNIISNYMDGLLIMNKSGQTLFVNSACSAMMGRPAEDIIGSTPGIPIAYSQPFEITILRPGRKPLLAEMQTVEIAWEEMPAYLVSLRDVSRYRLLEEQMRQSQKMEAVGHLAGGVAHEFNNLLTVIGGFAELLLKKLDPEDPLYEHAEEINHAGVRATRITNQLLAFSRRQTMHPELLNLNMVIRENIKLLQKLLGEEIELVTMLSSRTDLVHADRVQFDQVILNLAINARDAMASGGSLFIATDYVALTEEDTRFLADLIPGPYIRFTVRDTGCGMDEETVAHIFEPFFTTKRSGQGTGLGLSTVYGIVQQSGGAIQVKSAPGEGAAFIIYFPAAAVDYDADFSPETIPITQNDGLAGSETILLVEDEEEVRRLVRITLSMYGYVVIEASNGAEALARCFQQENPIRLMLTDVVMPHMNGKILTEQVRKYYPGIHVIYMSGYSGADLIRFGIMPTDRNFLQKPFKPEALLRAIRSTLDEARA